MTSFGGAMANNYFGTPAASQGNQAFAFGASRGAMANNYFGAPASQPAAGQSPQPPVQRKSQSDYNDRNAYLLSLPGSTPNKQQALEQGFARKQAAIGQGQERKQQALNFQNSPYGQQGGNPYGQQGGASQYQDAFASVGRLAPGMSLPPGYSYGAPDPNAGGWAQTPNPFDNPQNAAIERQAQEDARRYFSPGAAQPTQPPSQGTPYRPGNRPQENPLPSEGEWARRSRPPSQGTPYWAPPTGRAPGEVFTGSDGQEYMMLRDPRREMETLKNTRTASGQSSWDHPQNLAVRDRVNASIAEYDRRKAAGQDFDPVSRAFPIPGPQGNAPPPPQGAMPGGSGYSWGTPGQGGSYYREPVVTTGGTKFPEPSFTAQYGDPFGGTSSTPVTGRIDAMVQRLNDTMRPYQAGQASGRPQFNIPQLWGQAGDMVKGGWQNPFATPQQSPVAPSRLLRDMPPGAAAPIAPPSQGTPYGRPVTLAPEIPPSAIPPQRPVQPTRMGPNGEIVFGGWSPRGAQLTAAQPNPAMNPWNASSVPFQQPVPDNPSVLVSETEQRPWRYSPGSPGGVAFDTGPTAAQMDYRRQQIAREQAAAARHAAEAQANYRRWRGIA